MKFDAYRPVGCFLVQAPQLSYPAVVESVMLRPTNVKLDFDLVSIFRRRPLWFHVLQNRIKLIIIRQ